MFRSPHILVSLTFLGPIVSADTGSESDAETDIVGPAIDEIVVTGTRLLTGDETTQRSRSFAWVYEDKVSSLRNGRWKLHVRKRQQPLQPRPALSHWVRSRAADDSTR